ncbi:MAG: NAD(+)/NADH kinase [Chitinophagales bacterium]
MLFGFMMKRGNDRTLEVGRVIADHLLGMGAQVIDYWKEEDPLPDIFLVLGGDGTILRSARRAALLGVPVLGFNLGRIGYLAELEVDEAEHYMQRIIDQEYQLEERLMLDVSVYRGGSGIFQTNCLNEAAIIRSGVPKSVSIDVYLNESYLACYQADGVICATPTGSTAYSLSAGGPVIAPDIKALVLTPVSPGILSLRPLVIGADKVIKIIPSERSALTVDGQEDCLLEPGDQIIITESSSRLKLVKLKKRGIFDLLERKAVLRAPGTKR